MAYNNYSNNRNNNKPYNKNGGGNNNNRNSGNNRNNGNFPPVPTYVGAPYNFVPFNKEVVEVDKEQMPIHNKISEELITGEIDYTLTAKTDIMIDDGKAHFHKNARGEYSIPGSTMRGLIRNNVQILGLSYVGDDIDDYRLMYRNVASGVERKQYNEILGSKQISISAGSKPVGVLTNVKGGYIVKKNGKYYIYQTTVDKLTDNLNEMNYYVLSERNVVNNRNDFPFLKQNPQVMQHKINSFFVKNEWKGKVHYKGERNSEYKPGYYEVSYEVTNIKNVSKLGTKNQFSKNGYLVASGYMNEKKALYVIPSIDMKKDPLEIPEKDVAAFKIDFENKKNTLGKNADYFNLPQRENEYKPVFYIYLNGKMYFGFTPRLRLFYEHSIKDGFKQKRVDFDYAKSIFGCIAKDKTGYKSKVSFSEATIASKAAMGNAKKLILAGPKPTSYLDYITQGETIGTYNQSEFDLRGVKQYWLHEKLQLVDSTDKVKVGSDINPLSAGAVFKGKIRFNNLTKDELGLLVWSLKLNDNSWMNVGKAKAYGYGVIAVSDIQVKTVDLKKAYSMDLSSIANPMESASPEELIEAYKETVNRKLGGKKIDELPSIKEFFVMKDSTRIPDNTDIRYMSIDNREYQNRKLPLKNASAIAKK